MSNQQVMDASPESITTPNCLTYWLNRLDVMSRTQCVELTAEDAADLRELLKAHASTVAVLASELHRRISPETEAERAGRLMVEAARR